MTREEFDKEIEIVNGVVGKICPTTLQDFLWDRFKDKENEDMKMFFALTLYFLFKK